MVNLSNDVSPCSAFQDEVLSVQDGIGWIPAHAVLPVTTIGHHFREILKKAAGLRILFAALTNCLKPLRRGHGDIQAICVRKLEVRTFLLEKYGWRTIRVANLTSGQSGVKGRREASERQAGEEFTEI